MGIPAFYCDVTTETTGQTARNRLARCWWTVWGSNPRPQRCERCALPAELTAHMKLIEDKTLRGIIATFSPGVKTFFSKIRERGVRGEQEISKTE